MKLLAWCVCLIACSVEASTDTPRAGRQPSQETPIDLDPSIGEMVPLLGRENLPAPPSSVPRERPYSALITGMMSAGFMIVAVHEIHDIIMAVSEDCLQKQKAICEIATDTYSPALLLTFFSTLADLLFIATVFSKGQSNLITSFFASECFGKVGLLLLMIIVFYMEPMVGRTYALLMVLWASILALGLLNSALIAAPIIEHCRLPAEQPEASSASA